jgi:hypothetical protein
MLCHDFYYSLKNFIYLRTYVRRKCNLATIKSYKSSSIKVDPWSMLVLSLILERKNSICHEKDDLTATKPYSHDCCERDDLVVSRSLFKINVRRMTSRPLGCFSWYYWNYDLMPTKSFLMMELKLLSYDQADHFLARVVWGKIWWPPCCLSMMVGRWQFGNHQNIFSWW